MKTGGGGGGGLKFLNLPTKELFLSFSSLTLIVSDIQYDFNKKKSKKWRKYGVKVFSHVVPRRLCPTT